MDLHYQHIVGTWEKKTNDKNEPKGRKNEKMFGKGKSMRKIWYSSNSSSIRSSISISSIYKDKKNHLKT